MLLLCGVIYCALLLVVVAWRCVLPFAVEVIRCMLSLFVVDGCGCRCSLFVACCVFAVRCVVCGVLFIVCCSCVVLLIVCCRLWFRVRCSLFVGRCMLSIAVIV